MAVDRVEAIDADLEEKIAALRVQAEATSAAAREEAAGVVRSMLETGEPKRSVAERLGIPVADITAAQRTASLPGTDTDQSSGDSTDA